VIHPVHIESTEVIAETTTEKIQKSLESLFTELGYMGNEEEVLTAITNYVVVQYRTHQQNFFRTINRVIHAYATAPSDLRNEASVKWCQKVQEMDDVNGCYFPFV